MYLTNKKSIQNKKLRKNINNKNKTNSRFFFVLITHTKFTYFTSFTSYTIVFKTPIPHFLPTKKRLYSLLLPLRNHQKECKSTAILTLNMWQKQPFSLLLFNLLALSKRAISVKNGSAKK